MSYKGQSASLTVTVTPDDRVPTSKEASGFAARLFVWNLADRLRSQGRRGRHDTEVPEVGSWQHAKLLCHG
jgi:hypothetical protein